MRPVQHWQPALRGAPNENPFCELMARSNCVCAACLEVQRKLTEKIGARSRAVTCFAGLSDSAVPIRIGDQLIGFLQTGQIVLKQPTKSSFDRAAKQLVTWGVQVDLRKAREAYLHTKVLTKKQYAATLRLLEIFGRHLSILSNQIAVENLGAEPAAVTRRKNSFRKTRMARSVWPRSRRRLTQARLTFATIQARDRTNVYRVRRASPDRKSENAPARPQSPRERDRLRSRISISHSF